MGIRYETVNETVESESIALKAALGGNYMRHDNTVTIVNSTMAWIGVPKAASRSQC